MYVSKFFHNYESYLLHILLLQGVLVAANPLHACVNISGPPDSDSSLNWFVLMSGNACSFETKVKSF